MAEQFNCNVWLIFSRIILGNHSLLAMRFPHMAWSKSQFFGGVKNIHLLRQVTTFSCRRHKRGTLRKFVVPSCGNVCVCVPNNPTWFSPGSKWSITPEKTPGTIGLSLLSLPMSRAKTHVTENQCRLPAQAPTHICYPCNRTDSSPRRQPLEGLQLAMSHNPGT